MSTRLIRGEILKSLDAQLRMLTRLDELLLDESPDAIVATTPDGRIVYWSKGAEAIFGYTAGEAVSRLVNDLLVPPDYTDEEHRVVESVIAGKLCTYESLRRRKDGSFVHVDISCKAVHGGAAFRAAACSLASGLRRPKYVVLMAPSAAQRRTLRVPWRKTESTSTHPEEETCSGVRPARVG